MPRCMLLPGYGGYGADNGPTYDHGANGPLSPSLAPRVWASGCLALFVYIYIHIYIDNI